MRAGPKQIVGLAALGMAMAACASTPADETGGTYFVREGMVNEINPPITAIWDMQVEVMDDYGNFDPALMDADKWAAITAHAAGLRTQAARMAHADRFIVADPAGDLTEAPEGTDLAAIQGRLDTNTQAYRVMADAFLTHSEQLLAAAQDQDAEAVTMLVNDIQPVCKACHDVFWYPED